MKININDFVKVKLNDIGRAELERQHREFKKRFPGYPDVKPRTTDIDGFSKFQFHVLMNTFGHMMILGCEPPFESEIIIVDKV